MGSGPGRVTQLLRALNLRDEDVAAPVRRELQTVLSVDYLAARGLPSRDLTRELARVTKSALDPRRRAWKKWRTIENYRVRLNEFDGGEIAIQASPYTRGAGLMLWGFSCDARRLDDGAFVIFLNTAHQPGAVAATVAHELGHYVHRSIVGDDCSALAPLAADFAEHLDDQSELFADSLVALSAFGIEARGIERVFATRGWIASIAAALEAIAPDYRIDFSDRSMSPNWRVRYLAATIHFYKLREALIEAAGI